jgi:hypothetical protein
MAKNEKDSKVDQKVPLTPVVTEQTVGTTGKAQPTKKVDATPPEPKIPSLKVDFSKMYESLTHGKAEMPVEEIFKVNDVISFNVHDVLEHAVNQAISKSINKGEKLPVIVSRQLVLNNMCLVKNIYPLPCKKVNKEENATTSTYGVVPYNEQSFDVGGTTYRLFGFLKYPVLRTAKWVAVKYLTYLVVMTSADFEAVIGKKLTEDKEIELIEMAPVALSLTGK